MVVQKYIILDRLAHNSGDINKNKQCTVRVIYDNGR